jgi:hypothetical protein
MKKQLAASLFTVLIAAAGGCTTIDSHVRVDDWPELKIVEHDVSFSEMRTACKPYTPPLMTPLGCTVFYLDAGEAHIYVAKQLKFKFLVDHERLHAAGYDHPGSTNMKEMIERWRAKKQAEKEVAELAQKLAAREAAEKLTAAGGSSSPAGDKIARTNPADYLGSFVP